MTISQFGPNWRSLRFNDVEQGLAYVVDDEIMDGKVLAYEYLRAMAAATAAVVVLVLALVLVALLAGRFSMLQCPYSL